MSQPVYVLNPFNVSNKDEYLAYSRRSAKEVKAHGVRVEAKGGSGVHLSETVTGFVFVTCDPPAFAYGSIPCNELTP